MPDESYDPEMYQGYVDMAELTCERVAKELKTADALLIGAGAGMGVDSGLPDFRGIDGLWKKVSPMQGQLLADDPASSWGFFAHCLELFRTNSPHPGFAILKSWTEKYFPDYFIFTTNIDRHFQESGFPEERILEEHGSIYHHQCIAGLRCSAAIWPVPAGFNESLTFDRETLKLTSPMPTCPNCGDLARPNVLLFGDRGWVPQRTVAQEEKYYGWVLEKKQKKQKIVALEFGAGTAVPTVRVECQKVGHTLIRINPHQFLVVRDHREEKKAISLPLGALDAVRRIDKYLQAMG